MRQSLLGRALHNGYTPLLPILAWNLVLWSRLPSAFQPENFNQDIPLAILVSENVFRAIVFVLPAFAYVNPRSRAGRRGLFVFLFGVGVYFASWLPLIFAPDSAWSTSQIGFTAPAWTPALWLIGLAHLLDSYYFRVRYSKWHFLVPSVLFVGFHLSHVLLVHGRAGG